MAQERTARVEIITKSISEMLRLEPTLINPQGNQLKECTVYLLANENVPKDLKISVPDQTICITPKTVLFQLGARPFINIYKFEIDADKARVFISLNNKPKPDYYFTFKKVNREWQLSDRH